MKTLLQYKKGFVAVFTLFIIVFSLSAFMAVMVGFIIKAQEVSRNDKISKEVFLVAESGIEDALLRIKKGWDLPPSYNLALDDSTAVIEIGEIIGGSRTIQSEATQTGIVKKTQAIFNMGGDLIQFFFGAHVGEGGLMMQNGSSVIGNVVSGGNIMGTSGTFITGSVEIAQNNRIENMQVSGDVKTYSCNNSTIGGILYYVAGGSITDCPNGGLSELPEVLEAIPLPITNDQIDAWKAEAEVGGVYVGDYTFSNNQTKQAGPLKIQGNLIFSNSNTFILTGTIWVTGDIIANNNTLIQLSNAVYGGRSGILISDGIIDLKNNTAIQGSGQEGSYLMVLSTSSANPAIMVRNTSDASIFYAGNGYITLSNNTSLREVSAYGINLDNNASVQYEIGLANSFFVSGPGSGWQLENWQEVE